MTALGRRVLRSTAIALLLAVTLWLLAPLALKAAAKWLIIEAPLRQARAVVVFGGQVPYRAMEAARLYQQGWAKEVWLTQGGVTADDIQMRELGIDRPTESDYSRMVLERRGVPASAIVLLAGHNANTAQEVATVAAAAEVAGGEPVIVVTSKFHARRVAVIWQRLVGARQDVIVRYTPDDPFDPDTWWHTTGDAKVVFYEWFGLFNAWLGFPMDSVKRT